MGRAEDITDDLRRDILAGEFAPGDRLVELSLTQRYRCGRNAVQSAFVELSTEGLVDCDANRAAKVRSISIPEAIQITEARSALECLIAAKAARYASTNQRTELEQIITDMGDAVEHDDLNAYSELDQALHGRLREISRHAVAAHLAENLRNRSAHLRFPVTRQPGRSQKSFEQHAAIVEAVVAGDEAAAAEAMHEHLYSVIEVLARWED